VENDEKIQISENSEKNIEISINYTISSRSWNHMETTIDDVFAYNVALKVLKDNEDLEPTLVEECCHRSDWLKWKDAIQSELNSLTKCKVCRPVVQTP
jgi:hypothetical protein